MQVREWLFGLREKKVDKRDLIIAILIFSILAIFFFGWFYFREKANPIDTGSVVKEAKYGYLFTIYEPQQLKRPMGIAVNQWGDLLVTDSLHHRIAIFDRNGKFKKNLGQNGSGPGQFNYPTSIAVSGSKVIVADFYNQRVQIINMDGKQLSVIPSPADAREIGTAVMPVSVATDAEGLIYVSDVSAHRILVFDETGKFIRLFGKPGTNPGELSYVNGITINDQTGSLYLANSSNGRVDEFDSKGNFIKTLTASSNLTNPKGIAWDPFNSRVYVADTFAHKIFGLNQDGGLFETIGAMGIDPGSFNFPNGVAIDEDGRLYVADRENNRIEVYAR